MAVRHILRVALKRRVFLERSSATEAAGPSWDLGALVLPLVVRCNYDRLTAWHPEERTRTTNEQSRAQAARRLSAT